MAIQNIISGSGFGSMIPYNNAGVGTDAQGSDGNDGYGTLPIARWTSIPHRISRSNTDELQHGPSTTVGIMTFHASGIKEVDFILNGGATVTVTEPEFNPVTGFNEYCVRMDRDSVITNMGETSDNAQLRAIIRPNHGTPKIMQHDVAGGISGDLAFQTFFGTRGTSGGYCTFETGGSGGLGMESNLLVEYPVGRDGGTYIRPGEASFYLSLYKAVDDPTTQRTPCEIFIGPSGSDNNDGLTPATAVKTFKNAIVKARRRIGVIKGETYDDYAQFTDGYVTHDEIIFTLLEGEYDESVWYWEYTTDDIASQPQSNNKYQLGMEGGFLLVRGQPGLDKSQVVLKSTNWDIDYTGAQSEDNLRFNMSRGGLFNNFELRNLTVRRDNPDPTKCDITFGPSRGYLSLVQRPDPIMRGAILHNNITIKTKSPLRDYFGTSGFATINSRGLNFPGIGVVALNVDVQGGTSHTKMYRYHINTKCDLHGGDQFAFSPVIIGCLADKVPDAIIPLRKIDFSPENNAGSGLDPAEINHYHNEFTGWYAPVRQGTFDKMLEAWDNFSDMGGFTWEHPVNSSGVDLGTPETVWRKINIEAMTGQVEGIPELYDPVAYTSPGLGAPYGGLGSANPGTDNFFEMDPTNPDPRIELFGSVCLGFAYGTGSEYRDQLVPPLYGQPWMNEYYENKYMVLLDHIDDSDTRTSGYVIWDADKPLVYGTNQNQQQFLFRYAGSSAESYKRFGSTADIAPRFTDTAHGWARGFTTEEVPQYGGTRPDYDFNAQPTTNESYPVIGMFTYGAVDADHADFAQSTVDARLAKIGYTIGGPVESAINLGENHIYAYNKIHGMKGQFGNWDITAKNYNLTGEDRFISNAVFKSNGSVDTAASTAWFGNLPIEDIAIVNNDLLGDKTENNTTQWKMSGHEVGLNMHNFIMEHNTIIGGNIIFEYGTKSHTTEGVTQVDNEGAGNSFGRGFTYSRDPYGNLYDCTNSHWYIRNNFNDIFGGPNFKVDARHQASLDNGFSTQGWTLGITGSVFTKAMVVDRNVMYAHRGYEEGLGALPQSTYEGTRGVTGTIELKEDERPQFTNPYNNASVPYTSSLVGLGAIGSRIHDDINRSPRRNRPTVGAHEYTEPSTDHILRGNSTTSTTFSPTSLNLTQEDLESKNIVVEAVTPDGSVLTSTNSVVLESILADRTEQIPILEAPEGDDGVSTTFLFEPAAGGGFVDDSEYFPPRDEDGNLDTTDWIPNKYPSMYGMRAYGNQHGSWPKNFVFFIFNPNSAGDSDATDFDTKVQGLANQMELTVPSENLTLGLCADTVVTDNFSIDGASMRCRRYYLNDLSTGLTVDIPENVLGPWTISKPPEFNT